MLVNACSVCIKIERARERNLRKNFLWTEPSFSLHTSTSTFGRGKIPIFYFLYRRSNYGEKFFNISFSILFVLIQEHQRRTLTINFLLYSPLSLSSFHSSQSALSHFLFFSSCGTSFINLNSPGMSLEKINPMTTVDPLDSLNEKFTTWLALECPQRRSTQWQQ